MLCNDLEKKLYTDKLNERSLCVCITFYRFLNGYSPAVCSIFIYVSVSVSLLDGIYIFIYVYSRDDEDVVMIFFSFFFIFI